MKRTTPALLLIAGLFAAPLPTTVAAQDQQDQSLGRYIDDATITARVKARLVDDPETSALRINVETQNGVVQISGFADSEDERRRAAALANSVPNVRYVENDIVVKNEAGDESDDTAESAESRDDQERSSDRSSEEERASEAARSGSSTGVYRY